MNATLNDLLEYPTDILLTALVIHSKKMGSKKPQEWVSYFFNLSDENQTEHNFKCHFGCTPDDIVELIRCHGAFDGFWLAQDGHLTC